MVNMLVMESFIQSRIIRNNHVADSLKLIQKLFSSFLSSIFTDTFYWLLLVFSFSFFHVSRLRPSRRVNRDLTGFVFLKMNATCAGTQSHGSAQQLRTVSVSECACVCVCVCACV